MLVGERQRHRVRAGGRDAHSRRGRPGGVQARPTPGERQRRPRVEVLRPRRVGHARLQGRVEQRRMQTERTCQSGQLMLQGDLRKHVLAVAPHGAQAAKRRAVVQTAIGQPVVQLLHVQGRRTRRRPHRAGACLGSARRRSRDRLSSGGRAKRAGRVTRPGLGPIGPLPEGVAGGLGARVDIQHPAARLVRLAHRQLELDARLLAQGEGRLQQELLHDLAADLARDVQRELQEHRASQQPRAPDDVVGEPRLRLQREPAREQPPLATGDSDRRAEQRMTARRLADRRRLPRAARCRRQPVAPVLECICRQRDRARAGEQRPEIHARSVDVRPRERAQQSAHLRLPGALQRREERGLA